MLPLTQLSCQLGQDFDRLATHRSWEQRPACLDRFDSAALMNIYIGGLGIFKGLTIACYCVGRS